VAVSEDSAKTPRRRAGGRTKAGSSGGSDAEDTPRPEKGRDQPAGENDEGDGGPAAGSADAGPDDGAADGGPDDSAADGGPDDGSDAAGAEETEPRGAEAGPRTGPRTTEPEQAAAEETGPGDGADDAATPEVTAMGHDSPTVRAARRAAAYVKVLTGRDPESVISIERRDQVWHIGVEAVEMCRIPDTADILAIYEVVLRPNGELISYHRSRRYARGQLDRHHHHH
jgi:hypothetical protein